ncbi:transposase [Paucibacter sp. Y2R2-4]|uniref:transposase n=1 Tax=Paucibacter sp. Y2R2-4 TaxID=2893553 RepID=UPI0021E4CFCC|nr:transposase [Paucibacter sp. Y2R2-4]MCV2350447.1 transposase [Paucibacter sp. Y2R2-4]
MRRSKFTEEQIIGFLKQAEAGMAVAEICRKGGFSDATFYKWRAKFGLEGQALNLKPPMGHKAIDQDPRRLEIQGQR